MIKRLLATIFCMVFFGSAGAQAVSLPRYSIGVLEPEGSESGLIEFSIQAQAPSVRSPDNCNVRPNTLTGIEVLEDGTPFQGQVAPLVRAGGRFNGSVSFYSAAEPLICFEKELKHGDISKVLFSNGLITYQGLERFNEVSNSYATVQILTPGMHTISFKPKATEEFTADYSTSSFTVKWPALDIARAKAATFTGLTGGKALVGKAISTTAPGGLCVAWVPGGMSPYDRAEWSNFSKGPSYIPTAGEIGKTLAPHFYLDTVEINGVRTQSPCNPGNGYLARAPFFAGPSVAVANRATADWRAFEGGIPYGKSKTFDVTLTDRGYGLPKSVKVRQRVGTGTYTPWKAVNVASRKVRFATNAKDKVRTEFSITDKSGTYVLAAVGNLKPDIKTSMSWKSKTLIDGLWQGGVLRISVSISSWYKGKVSSIVATDHAYDFLGRDNGKYSKTIWFKPIKGSLVIDVPVSYHGMYVYVLGFDGNPGFTYSPGSGIDFD